MSAKTIIICDWCGKEDDPTRHIVGGDPWGKLTVADVTTDICGSCIIDRLKYDDAGNLRRAAA